MADKKNDYVKLGAAVLAGGVAGYLIAKKWSPAPATGLYGSSASFGMTLPSSGGKTMAPAPVYPLGTQIADRVDNVDLRDIQELHFIGDGCPQAFDSLPTGAKATVIQRWLDTMDRNERSVSGTGIYQSGASDIYRRMATLGNRFAKGDNSPSDNVFDVLTALQIRIFQIADRLRPSSNESPAAFRFRYDLFVRNFLQLFCDLVSNESIRWQSQAKQLVPVANVIGNPFKK